MTYTVQSAKANLDLLLSEAAEGKNVVIEREGQPAVLLTIKKADEPASKNAERVFGLDRGLVEYDDSALDPLSDEELADYGFGFMLEKKLVGEKPQAQKAG